MALLRRLTGFLRPGTRTRAPRAPKPVVVSYAPRSDGHPDPGEVVWAWVPFEDDPKQGKDRPVLLLGKRGRNWVGLMLTSKDHDHDAAHQASQGRHWMDVGTGPWDRQLRPSEVRLDRLIELRTSAIRREGSGVSKLLFDRVLARAREFHDLG